MTSELWEEHMERRLLTIEPPTQLDRIESKLDQLLEAVEPEMPTYPLPFDGLETPDYEHKAMDVEIPLAESEQFKKDGREILDREPRIEEQLKTGSISITGLGESYNKVLGR
jgi:hypothetical protein